MNLEFDLLLVNMCGFVFPLRANPFTHSSFKPYGFYHVHFFEIRFPREKSEATKRRASRLDFHGPRMCEVSICLL